MPSYRLTYFNARGRGETLRLLFSAAGKDFEDRRLEGPEWAKLKPGTPTGKLPMVEIDGVAYTDCIAIARYLGDQFGLGGDTPLERLKVDMIAGHIEDMLMRMLAIIYTIKDEKAKEEEMKKQKDEAIPEAISKLEGLTTSDGYLTGKKLTWVDIHFYSVAYGMMKLIQCENLLDNYPKLKAVYDKVESNPGIAAWLKKRPVTER